jgi:hypothetical protein
MAGWIVGHLCKIRCKKNLLLRINRFIMKKLVKRFRKYRKNRKIRNNKRIMKNKSKNLLLKAIKHKKSSLKKKIKIK